MSSPFFPFSLLFPAAAAGIIVDRYCPVARSFWLALFVTAFVFGAGFLALSRFSSRRRSWFSTLSLLSLLILTASFFGLRHQNLYRFFEKDHLAFLVPEEGTPAILEMTVDEMPTLQPDRRAERFPGSGVAEGFQTIFCARILAYRWRGEWYSASGRVRVVLAEPHPELMTGDQIRCAGTVSFPPQARNPGERSIRERLRYARIPLSFYQSAQIPMEKLSTPPRFPFRRGIEKYRRKLGEKIERGFSDSTRGIVAAMLLGIRSNLDDSTRNLFRETGTAHLLAISGLHVGIIALFVHALLRLFRFPRRLSALTTALVILFYFALTDHRSPALRATILVLVVCGGNFFRRRSFSVNTLCAAGTVILLIRPGELFDTGAHLSFLATGVFLWFPSPERLFKKIPSIARWELTLRALERIRPIRTFFLRFFLSRSERLLTGGFLSAVIWLVLLPLVLNRLHLCSPAVIFLTPILTPFVFLGLCSGFLFLLLPSALGPVGDCAATFSDANFHLIRSLLERIQAIPHSSALMIGPPTFWCLIFYFVLVALTLFPLRNRGKMVLIFTLCWTSLLFGGRAFHSYLDRRAERIRIDLLSVGHGSAAIIRFPDRKAILCDCGSSSPPEKVARTVSEALLEFGIADLDGILLSHADADHINGVTELLKQISTARLIVPPNLFDADSKVVQQLKAELEQRKIPIETVHRGDTLASKGFPQLTILHPDARPKDPNDTNGNSIVLALRCQNGSVLFPGDLDAETPPFLSEPPEHFDLMIAPHHGGKSRSHAPLLSWATPETVIISGAPQRNELPIETLLKESSVALYRTDSDGAVEIVLQKEEGKKDRITVTSWIKRKSEEKKAPPDSF